MIVERWRAIREALPHRVRLVAVSKGHPSEDILALIDAGQRDFGENRADALAARAKQFPDARWHFIGPVQSNKRKLLAAAHLVHSWDRPDIDWPTSIPVLVQVDFTGEARRSGLPAYQVAGAVARLRLEGVDVRGLSTLPPQGEDPRKFFVKLREMANELDLPELSMGMSADWRVAVEEGATMIRVGTAIFGPHPAEEESIDHPPDKKA